MKTNIKYLSAMLVCFALFLNLDAQTFEGPLTDSLCVDAAGNFSTVAPSVELPSNFPTDAAGNYVFCPDGTEDGSYPLAPGNGNLPNNDYIIEFSNGSPLIVSNDGTWNSVEANLGAGDVVYITALTYDLDSVNGDLEFAGTLCPLLDILYPDITPCVTIDELLTGGNDGSPGLDDLEEIISFAGSLSGDVSSVDSIISAFYGINDAIAGFGAAICFGLSETIEITALEDCSGGGEIFGCMDATACNYNPNATADNGSCLAVGDACDDMDANTINDVYDSNCDCTGIVGIETFNAQSRIMLDKMYPLPVEDMLNLSITAANYNNLAVKIFNIDGQLLSINNFSAANDLSNISLNTSELANGVYFLEIAIEDYSITEKFIK